MNQSRSEKLLSVLRKYLTVFAVGMVCVFFVYQMRPKTDKAGDFQYRDFGRFPVIDGGRIKPLSTVASTNLMIVTHRGDFYDADDQVRLLLWNFPKRHPGTKWLLDAETSPLPGDAAMRELFPNGAAEMVAFRHKVFRIENDQLLEFLDLKRVEGLRYSIVDIMAGNNGANAQRFQAEAERVRRMDPKKMTLFDGKVFELSQHIHLEIQLSTHSVPLAIPNVDGGDQWLSFGDAHAKYGALGRDLPDNIEAQTYKVYRDALIAYDNKDKAGFNKIVAKHLADLEAKDPAMMRAMNVEVFFNDFAPFYQCLTMYAILAVIGVLSWLVPEWSRPIQKACLAAMAVTFVVHLSGLIMRMYLQDRLFVFVTNLYSSAVFIGLGCAFFCMISEAIFRNGIALVCGSIGAFLTLIIAHMLSLSGDTLEMMQAVLDTNFWLATHVTCVTLGYVSAFVAGLMGCAYIFLGVFTPMLRKEGAANLARMTYGVLCAGMFLSFVGTVLGGLWADYSWGRFWGWDPKENGALLIVIWIALILHARWGGMVKQRGIAVLAVMGIVVTSWSWFGTNFLGVGLHSYGFRQGAMTTLILIDLLILGVAAFGALLPLNMWASFRPPTPVEPLMSKTGPRPRPVSV